MAAAGHDLVFLRLRLARLGLPDAVFGLLGSAKGQAGTAARGRTIGQGIRDSLAYVESRHDSR